MAYKAGSPGTRLEIYLSSAGLTMPFLPEAISPGPRAEDCNEKWMSTLKKQGTVVGSGIKNHLDKICLEAAKSPGPLDHAPTGNTLDEAGGASFGRRPARNRQRPLFIKSKEGLVCPWEPTQVKDARDYPPITWESSITKRGVIFSKQHETHLESVIKKARRTPGVGEYDKNNFPFNKDLPANKRESAAKLHTSRARARGAQFLKRIMLGRLKSRLRKSGRKEKAIAWPAIYM